MEFYTRLIRRSYLTSRYYFILLEKDFQTVFVTITILHVTTYSATESFLNFVDFLSSFASLSLFLFVFNLEFKFSLNILLLRFISFSFILFIVLTILPDFLFLNSIFKVLLDFDSRFKFLLIVFL